VAQVCIRTKDLRDDGRIEVTEVTIDEPVTDDAVRFIVDSWEAPGRYEIIAWKRVGVLLFGDDWGDGFPNS
jgi:hypothetical protein